MVEGRRRLVERLHAEGRRAPGGRKKAADRPSEYDRRIARERAVLVKEASERNRIRTTIRKASRAARQADKANREARRRVIDRECLASLAEIDPVSAKRLGWRIG
jgi:hypothetical protein